MIGLETLVLHDTKLITLLASVFIITRLVNYLPFSASTTKAIFNSSLTHIRDVTQVDYNRSLPLLPRNVCTGINLYIKFIRRMRPRRMGMGREKNSTKWNFIVCNVHLIELLNTVILL